MLTYGIIGAVTIAAGLAEKTCRDNGNVTGALAARKFGRFFLLGAGGWILAQWIAGMMALVF